MNYIKHFLYWLFQAKPSGLQPLPKDGRDYKLEDLGWWGYSPKQEKLILPTMSIKNQLNLLTCQWHSTAVQKEPDEAVPLSARSVVIKGKQLGLVGDRGLSNLRSGQAVMKSWGILPEKRCPDLVSNGWESYTAFNVDQFSDEAAKHKIKSYWFVNSASEAYKALDQKRIIVVGMQWYSGFNMSGGFSEPWIIEKKIGWAVGGHAFCCVGYDNDYHGKKVFIFQNSYGKGWGDNGKFYITEEYFVNEALKRWGGVVNLDEDIDELWIPKARDLFNRIKNKYMFIMRPHAFGAMYELNDKGIFHIPITIGSEKMIGEFDSYLRANSKFVGVSENDFELLTKYVKLQGGRVSL